MNSPPPDHPSDMVTPLWLSLFYLLGVTAVGGFIAGVFLLLLMLPDTDNPNPTLITDIIPYNVGDILDGSINAFVIFSFLMFFVILPLQLPGWLSMWGTVRKLHSLPRKIQSLSMIVSCGVARAVAVAYLWAIIGVGVAACGFDIYLAILNPNFAWINPDNTGIGDIFLIIGKALWLLAVVICIQLPVCLGLWYLNRPAPPIPDDPRWHRWRKGAVMYLKWGTTITVVAAICIFGYWGFEHYQEITESGRELDIFFGMFVLFTRTVVAIIYVVPIVFLAQLPGWSVMAWLESKKRQTAGIPKTPINALHLLKGTAIGYLAMITTAIPTWWFRLEYVNTYDRDIFTPYLTPVLGGLLWAQIPGWIALLLWLAWWLAVRLKRRPAL